ncbi:hypothetical protein [Streptomyces europaeiscabiei]|uniref:hypothetical protein n=1 Tax=Streptomyces europaeiscabiei TaxID=146819 RepID=UPI002E2773DE|nr:hypothetical protein OG858_37010 [Streptomyces europaeiscabiei]
MNDFESSLPHVTIELDEDGNLIDPSTSLPVPSRGVPHFLDRMLSIPSGTTDIFVFVHGWRNPPQRATAAACKLFEMVDRLYSSHPQNYPALGRYRGFYVLVVWPSLSNPFPSGYRRIRDRAHGMTTGGHAEFILAQLLGYLNTSRQVPRDLPPTLRTKSGQYLHCVGHSFGGRFLAEAIRVAADPKPPTLSWPWGDKGYQYAVDTLLVFQMAARADDFAGRFSDLLVKAPIGGPIILTFSRFDRALTLWHRIVEGIPGIGAYGAIQPSGLIKSIELPAVGQDFVHADIGQVTNVDASWKYRRGRWVRPEGAHSDIWHPESAHLLLGIAAGARVSM